MTEVTETTETTEITEIIDPTKPTLGIDKQSIRNPFSTLGLTEFLNRFIECGAFNIVYHDDRIGGLKSPRGTVLHYNDKKVYLDFWEYALPAYSGEAWDANFDLIIKLQHKNMSPERFEKSCDRKGMFKHRTPEERRAFLDKLVPWTFFSSRMMKQFIGKEDQIEQLPIERDAFFCGKNWKCRHEIKKKLDGLDIEYVCSSQEKRHSGRPLKDDEYIHKMRTSKFGLVLHGRGSYFTEAKNRREIDYMILKKPLLLNYKPYYYNPLEEGKHYIYIDDNIDLKKIEEMYNINEIAQNGYEWYQNNASPDGLIKSFLQIMNDRFGK